MGQSIRHLSQTVVCQTVSVPDRVSTHANIGQSPGTGSGCRQFEISNRMGNERPWERNNSEIRWGKDIHGILNQTWSNTWNLYRERKKKRQKLQWKKRVSANPNNSSNNKTGNSRRGSPKSSLTISTISVVVIEIRQNKNLPLKCRKLVMLRASGDVAVAMGCNCVESKEPSGDI